MKGVPVVNANFLERVAKPKSPFHSDYLAYQSGRISRNELSRVELLHAVDGWHPSVEGHNVLAEAAWRALGPSLEFLGIQRSQSTVCAQLRDGFA
jgi:lysophospholipase L1-like esterase